MKKPTRDEFEVLVAKQAAVFSLAKVDRGLRIRVVRENIASTVHALALSHGLTPRPIEEESNGTFVIHVFGFPRRRADAYFPADEQDDNLKAIFHRIRAAREMLPTSELTPEVMARFIDLVDGLATEGLGLLEGKGK